MAMDLVFTYECECGGKATNRTLDTTQNDVKGEIEIDFSFMCSQMELECEKCGKKYYTGDIEVLSEDEI